MELPKYHAVVRTVSDGDPQQPVLGKLDLSNWDKQHWRRGLFAIKDLIFKKQETNDDKIKIDMPVDDKQAKGLDIIFDAEAEDETSIEESFFDIM